MRTIAFRCYIDQCKHAKLLDVYPLADSFFYYRSLCHPVYLSGTGTTSLESLGIGRGTQIHGTMTPLYHSPLHPNHPHAGATQFQSSFGGYQFSQLLTVFYHPNVFLCGVFVIDNRHVFDSAQYIRTFLQVFSDPKHLLLPGNF